MSLCLGPTTAAGRKKVTGRWPLTFLLLLSSKRNTSSGTRLEVLGGHGRALKPRSPVSRRRACRSPSRSCPWIPRGLCIRRYPGGVRSGLIIGLDPASVLLPVDHHQTFFNAHLASRVSFSIGYQVPWIALIAGEMAESSAAAPSDRDAGREGELQAACQGEPHEAVCYVHDLTFLSWTHFGTKMRIVCVFRPSDL